MRKSVRTRSQWGDYYSKLFDRMEAIGGYLFKINRHVTKYRDGELENRIAAIERGHSGFRVMDAQTKRNRRQQRNLVNASRGAFGSDQPRNPSKPSYSGSLQRKYRKIARLLSKAVG